jgi:hypothetical protein
LGARVPFIGVGWPGRWDDEVNAGGGECGTMSFCYGMGRRGVKVSAAVLGEGEAQVTLGT